MLERFHQRLRELLDERPEFNEVGELHPSVLAMSPAAKNVWVKFHDDIEGELGAGGEMEDVQDIASKAADNAVRLASLFHLFDHGLQGDIGEEHMKAASNVATWHLYEARRFLGEISVPTRISNAMRLDKWLLSYFHQADCNTISQRHILQNGPHCVRKLKDFEEAARELKELDRIRIIQDVKLTSRIEINPKLLNGGKYGAA